jgi:hypothetical protein
MSTKLVRMEIDCETILKKYGKTPSDGVVEMERRIQMSQPKVTLDDTEWAHMEALLKKYSKSPSEMTLEKSQFQTAAAIKKFGPIEKDEEYVEPSGRQGRTVR